jgi:hypothetical protein
MPSTDVLRYEPTITIIKSTKNELQTRMDAQIGWNKSIVTIIGKGTPIY